MGVKQGLVHQVVGAQATGQGGRPELLGRHCACSPKPLTTAPAARAWPGRAHRPGQSGPLAEPKPSRRAQAAGWLSRRRFPLRTGDGVGGWLSWGSGWCTGTSVDAPWPLAFCADCLLMLAYKDKSDRAKGLRERSSLTLEDICGLEPGLPYEGLVHTLAIVCLSQAVMLGFDSRQAMCAWDARIRYALGEGECLGRRPREGFPRGPGPPLMWTTEAGATRELHRNEGTLVDTPSVGLLGPELRALDEWPRRARPCLGWSDQGRAGSVGLWGFKLPSSAAWAKTWNPESQLPPVHPPKSCPLHPPGHVSLGCAEQGHQPPGSERQGGDRLAGRRAVAEWPAGRQ